MVREYTFREVLTNLENLSYKTTTFHNQVNMTQFKSHAIQNLWTLTLLYTKVWKFTKVETEKQPKSASFFAPKREIFWEKRSNMKPANKREELRHAIAVSSLA